MRLLLAVADDEFKNLMYATLVATLHLIYFDVGVVEVYTPEELLEYVDRQQDDLLFLDWQMVGAGTAALVEEILNRYPRLRVVVLLPEPQQQYRRQVWEAGACNGIPKEHIDQEWLSAALCIMYRAIQREARLLEKLNDGASTA